MASGLGKRVRQWALTRESGLVGSRWWGGRGSTREHLDVGFKWWWVRWDNCVGRTKGTYKDVSVGAHFPLKWERQHLEKSCLGMAGHFFVW